MQNCSQKLINYYLLKSLNYKRIVNLFKLSLSFYLSRLLKKNWHWGMPASLSIEPTTACNLGCSQCPSGIKAFSRTTGNLNPEIFESVLHQTSEHLIWMTFYFQGEPFINKHLFRFIKQASEKGIFTASSTNGHFLSPENCEKIIDSGLNQLIVSIDGITQEVYEAYREEGNLNVVMEGLKRLVKLKKEKHARHLNIIWQMIALKTNEHQINTARQMALELGVDEFRVKTAQVYSEKDKYQLVPENEKLARYRFKDGKWIIKNQLYNHCWRLWQGCVVSWDGSLIPCCFDKDGKYSAGLVTQGRFIEIWKGEKLNAFRKQVFNHRKSVDICQNCSEGSTVWI